jgi:DNA polymerase III delta prime subunit
VLTELANTPVGLASYTVGLDFRLQEVMSLLDVRSNGVRVLGLYGMGGVGKTTLAKALCNKLVGHFECLSFISKVRENSANDDGIVSLQNKLIHDLSSGNVAVYSIDTIKDVVHEKRVLVVLDDIDNVTQLDLLIGRREWFFEGSRIIVTTRDREVLPKHLVNSFFEVRELGNSEALQLFSYHALRRDKPTDQLFDLSKKMVSLTGGLPLALEVFGSFLFDKRRIEEWEDALRKLEQIRPHDLQDVLKISFDGLDAQEKCIFLDIACLFIKMGMKREDVIDVLKGYGFRAEIAIRVLTAKSLIKVAEDNTLWMHDQVRDMGRQIVIEENPVYPGMRSRLWDRDAIMTVLKGEKVRLIVRYIPLISFSNSFLVGWMASFSTPSQVHASMFLCVTLNGKRSTDICAPRGVYNISVLCLLNFLHTHTDEFWLVKVDKRLRNFGREDEQCSS